MFIGWNLLFFNRLLSYKLSWTDLWVLASEDVHSGFLHHGEQLRVVLKMFEKKWYCVKKKLCVHVYIDIKDNETLTLNYFLLNHFSCFFFALFKLFLFCFI